MEGAVFYLLILVCIFGGAVLNLWFRRGREDNTASITCGVPVLVGFAAMCGYWQGADAVKWFPPYLLMLLITVAALCLPFYIATSREAK